jgi:hypothetical protein
MENNMTVGLAISGSNTIIERLKEIYDFEDICSVEDLSSEMLGSIRLRAGVPIDRIVEEDVAPILPLPENMQESLTCWLKTMLDVETLKILRSTMDLTGKTVVFYCSRLDLIQSLGNYSTLHIQDLKAEFTSEDNEGKLFCEVLEGKDEDALLESICEFIDHYKILPKLYISQSTSLH